MSARQTGGKMADCGVPQPTTTRQMRSGASAKVRIAQVGACPVTFCLGQHLGGMF